jgi:hypothetical protein
MHVEKIKLEIIATVASNKKLTTDQYAKLIQEMDYNLNSNTPRVVFTDATEIREYDVIEGTHEII